MKYPLIIASFVMALVLFSNLPTQAENIVVFDLRSSVITEDITPVLSATHNDEDATQDTQGLIVASGQIIFWEIWVTVRGSENGGLALASVDLVQDEDNPGKFDIPAADGVPPGMESFSRPEGITNPSEGVDTTGYVGAQRGSVGAQNLLQIGGAQNTLGDSSQGIAENPHYILYVGTNEEVLLAEGAFLAPRIAGRYCFRIENAHANVLDSSCAPPYQAQVHQAAVTYDKQAFCISVITSKPEIGSQ